MFYLCKSVGRFRRKFSYFNKLMCHKYMVLRHKGDRPPWTLIFYGTDKLSEVTLRALNANRLSNEECKVVQNLEVVCIQSDCAVRRYASQSGLKIHPWPYDVPANVFDVGVVVSFGHMIPSSSILACKYGIINAHPSLLPRWRGAAPIFHTILNGDEITGVTITQVSPNKFDVGNILMQEQYSVPQRYTAKMLTEDLSKIAAKLVLKTLENLPYYIKNSYSQPSVGKILARKIKPQNCIIDWAQDSSTAIDRKFRAFDGFFDVSTTWNGVLKIDILEIASPQETEEAKISELLKKPVSPGYCYFHKRRKVLFVKCMDGWIGIKTMRIPRRGKITALDFYNGFITKVDSDKCYFI